MKTTETTTEHTPGPWLAGQTITAADPDRAPGSYERITIASRVNNMANARLIAAAPDLLELCQTVLLRLDVEHAERIAKGETNPHFICAALRDDLRAAIAKANGGAQ